MADRNLYISSLLAGGAAGLFVDIVLYPLDTIKTRLQSEMGFWKAGGFRQVYRGIGPQVIASAPQAALFFVSYETFKAKTTPIIPSHYHPVIHMVGASIAEMVCCTVRVPMEVVKQRKQISMYLPPNLRLSSLQIARHAYQAEGILGFYRGYFSTIMREIPFSFIQFPILEFLKVMYSTHLINNKQLDSWDVAFCGAIAGGTAAAVTTPLDVVKTRIILASHEASKTGALKVTTVMKTIYRKKGVRGLFAGFTPRVIWITLGGYIFFGTYDFCFRTAHDQLSEES